MKVNILSRMTPSNFGFCINETRDLLIKIGSWIFISLEKAVNSVADDLDGDTCKFFLENNSVSVSRNLFNLVHRISYRS